MKGMSNNTGTWMTAPDGRVYRINYQDTLTRLLADGWTIQDAAAAPVPESVPPAADVAENGTTSEDAPASPTATPAASQSVTQHVRRQAALNAANAPVIRPPTARRKRG